MTVVKFNSIHIIEGLYHRKIEIKPDINLVTSNGENSTGKTTLLRILLYGLGYPIPSTKGMNFNTCNIRIEMSVNNRCLLIERDNDNLSIYHNEEETYFALPFDTNKILEFLLNEKSADILDNLLGSFYIDQDRGWTLLNRGTIVGDIRFNIERLVRGLSNKSCYNLEVEKANLDKEITKYKQMQSLGEYQAQYLHKETSLLPNRDLHEREKTQMTGMEIQKRQLQKELRRVELIIKKNENFIKYIEDMQLLIRIPSGEEIAVTKDNLAGFNDNHDIQKTRAKMLVHDIAATEKKIKDLEGHILYYDTQEKTYSNSLFSEISIPCTSSLIENFDANISSVFININQVNQTISELKKRRKELEEEIDGITTSNNDVSMFLNETVNTYALELDIQKYIVKDGIFTRVLKNLSGTIYHMLVYVFKLSFIKAIEHFAGLNLPIIIDSPSGREVNQANINRTLHILKRDFSHHQIILASINEYPALDDVNKIFVLENLVNVPTDNA